MSTSATPKSKTRRDIPRVRLHVRATFTGYKRSKVNQDSNSALLKIDGVQDIPAARWYEGKRCAFVYRAKKADVKGRKVRVIWGVVSRPHGSNGAVRARFAKNLPPRAMGRQIRVMMYPSHI